MRQQALDFRGQDVLIFQVDHMQPLEAGLDPGLGLGEEALLQFR